MHDSNGLYRDDPHWRDLVLLYEYFHGDDGSGVDASHQTGWTGLMAKLYAHEPALTEIRMVLELPM